jgi:hypothetical protein
LTSSEYADRLREDLSKDAVGEVHESVAEGLRYESDQAAF